MQRFEEQDRAHMQKIEEYQQVHCVGCRYINYYHCNRNLQKLKHLVKKEFEFMKEILTVKKNK